MNSRALPVLTYSRLTGQLTWGVLMVRLRRSPKSYASGCLPVGRTSSGKGKRIVSWAVRLRLLGIVYSEGCTVYQYAQDYVQQVVSSGFNIIGLCTQWLSVLYYLCLGGYLIYFYNTIAASMKKVGYKTSAYRQLGRHFYVKGGFLVANQKILPTYSSVAIIYRSNRVRTSVRGAGRSHITWIVDSFGQAQLPAFMPFNNFIMRTFVGFGRQSERSCLARFSNQLLQNYHGY